MSSAMTLNQPHCMRARWTISAQETVRCLTKSMQAACISAYGDTEQCFSVYFAQTQGGSGLQAD